MEYYEEEVLEELEELGYDITEIDEGYIALEQF